MQKYTRMVFQHVPKTGGRSFNKTFDIAFEDTVNIKESYGHDSTPEFQNKLMLQKNNGDFIVAFVRNPLTRFISAWNYLYNGGSNPADNQPRNVLHNYSDVNEFITTDAFEKITMILINHFKPMSNFIQNVDNYSFIGKFEHLKRDFLYVASRFELPNIKIQHMNRSKMLYPHINIHNLNAQSLSKLRDIYYEDFITFGYEEYLNHL